MPEIEKTDRPPPDAGHEDSDINVRAILKFSAGMLVAAVVVHFVIAWQWTAFDEATVKTDRKLPPLAAKERARLPENLDKIPEPRLQTAEVPDLAALRKKEESLLTRYEWATEKKGQVRIPIERAIELLSKPESSARFIRVRADAKPKKMSRVVMTKVALICLVFGLLSAVRAAAQDVSLPTALQGVKFEQRLGAQVPPDLQFRDDAGRNVRLEDYFRDRPILLVLAQYRCPRLCSVVLKGMVESVRQISLEPGKDFTIVVASIDSREGPALAAPKKESCLEAFGRDGTAPGWHFLTGEEAEIKRLADAVGFQFVYDPSKDEFRHPSGIMLLTPEGKMARYFFGFNYPSRDLRLGLVEASENRISAPADRVLLFACFAYDSESGKYLLSPMRIMRLAALLTVLVLGAYLAKSWLPRKEPARSLAAEQGAP